MTNIMVYDIEAERLEKLADKLDMTIAEIVEQLLDDSEMEEHERRV